jgi:AcrR family transcriptional regulator
LDEVIVAAATEHLIETGYGGFSIEDVSARTGVARTTIYRRWPTKAHLAIAVIAGLQREVPNPDTSDLRQDLLELTSSIIRQMAQPGVHALAAELVAAAAREPTLRQEAHQLWSDRRQTTIDVLRRAGRSDPEVAVDQLAGPVFYRLLITGDPLDEAYATRLVDAVLGHDHAGPEVAG